MSHWRISPKKWLSTEPLPDHSKRIMPFSRHAARWIFPLGLFILSVTWGYSWVLAKQALVYAPPFAFAAERCAGGTIALFLLLKLLRKPLCLIAPLTTCAIGITQVTGFMAFQIWALVEGGPGKTAVLVFTMPIWTLLIAWPVLGERIKGTQWLAALSTLTGLVLIIEPWNMHSSLLSKVLGLTAALCWAIGTVLVKRLRSRQQVDLLSLTAWQMFAGAIPLILLAWLVPERSTDWNMSYVSILIFMAIVTTGLCWWLWITILDRVPAWEACLSVLGTPVVAILSSRLMLNEAFKLSELTGMLLIGSGLLMLSLFAWTAARRSTR